MTVDFTKDDAAGAKVRDANGGDELSPTVHIGSRYLPNPRLADVRRALGPWRGEASTFAPPS